MLRCTIPVVKTNPSITAVSTTTTTPEVFTAKRLQTVSNVPLLTSRQQECGGNQPSDEFVSPYGRLPQTSRKTRHRHQLDKTSLPRRNDATSHVKHDVIAKRKRHRRLEPMAIKANPKRADHPQGNQANSSGVIEEKHVQKLRVDLIQAHADQVKNADSLRIELQWIHGHFPVLKLANARCSRSLRQKLFRNAVIHVFGNVILRKAWRFWHGKVIDAQRKERLQLSASRRLIAMFEKLSLDRVSDKFNWWRAWVMECQSQEIFAATVTLQQFARCICSRRDTTVLAAMQATLTKTLQDMSRHAEKIQKGYRRFRRRHVQRRREDAATVIQRIAMARIAHYARQCAAIIIQRNCLSYSKRCNHKRAVAIAQFLDRSRNRQAQRIQRIWLAYKLWRDWVLPRNVIEALVDQVEVVSAVLSIQSHLRGFHCRFILKAQSNSAVRIQKCWRSTFRRKTARVERQMLQVRRDLAASCVQRTLRQRRESHNHRVVMYRSTRPLYMRARHLGDNYSEQYRVQITSSAATVIQTRWRQHFAYEKMKAQRLVAALTLQRIWKRWTRLSQWRASVFEGRQQHYRQRLAAATKLQRWVRGRHFRCKKSTSAESIVEQMSAALHIQRWYRRRLYDKWGSMLAWLLAKELPKCVSAVNRIARCWRRHSARRLELLTQANKLAELIEQQRHQQVEGRAARCIQRMFRRAIDKRDGKLLLQRYKILVCADLKRRQQRAVVHKYLEEKTQQRRKKQESHAAVIAVRRVSSKRETALQQANSDPDTIESAPSSPYEAPQDYEDISWQQDTQGPVQYWSEEYQRAYLYDPATKISTWL